jgi:hypothetical protein
VSQDRPPGGPPVLASARDILARHRPAPVNIAGKKDSPGPTPPPPSPGPDPIPVTLAFETLAEARAYVAAGLDRGVDCPCCGQRAQRYLRRMYAANASWLIALVRKYEVTQDWVHIKDPALPSIGGDYGKCRWFGLIVPAPHEIRGSNKKSSGLWRPTHEGIEYVFGKRTIPRAVIVFNDRAEGFVGPQTSIIEALGRKFDWYQLMSGFLARDIAAADRQAYVDAQDEHNPDLGDGQGRRWADPGRL